MNINGYGFKASKPRESNIELLRCLLMFMIVIVHFTGHNIMDATNPVQLGDKNWWSSNILETFSEAAVNCFVIISGYYTIKLSFKKIVLFLLPIFFYELLFSIIQYNHYHQLSFTPFNYWFVRVYFGLLLLSPLLNYSLCQLTKKQIRTIIILLLAFYSVFTIVPQWNISYNSGKNIQLFIVLYFIGYYIRKYCNLEYKAWIFLVCFLFLGLILLFETYFLAKIGHYKGSATMSYNYDNIIIILMAIALFIIFQKLQIQSIFINWIAKSSFFVYIISENTFVYMHPYGLYDYIGTLSWNSSNMYPVLILISALGVFVCCILIDKIRLLIFGKAEQRIADVIDNILSRFTMDLPLNKL